MINNSIASIFPAFERNNVPVVFASNNLYAPYAGVFIQSLLDHANEESNYDIIILEREISEENKRLIKSLAAGYANVSIRFCDPSPLFTSFHHVYVGEGYRWPLEILYRIVAPHILNYPGRIISVGIDTLLKADIARLMDEALEGCCIGGVSNAPMIYAILLNNSNNRPWHIAARDIRPREYYTYLWNGNNWDDWKSYKDHLNGCLVVYDCERYVREVNLETVLNTAQQDYLSLDEDILYILMRGKVKLLDYAWNTRLITNAKAAERWKIASRPYEELYGSEVIQRAYEDPHLLHWVGNPKPWVCPDVPYGSEWWQTALRTPFVGHIIARMLDAQETRRAYYKKRYGKENVDIWDPSPKGIDRAQK